MSFATNGGNEIWWDSAGEGEPLLLAMGHASAGTVTAELRTRA